MPLSSSPLALDGNHFRLLADSTTDYAIFLLDPQGYVQTWNVGAQRLKGYLPEEIVGRHFSVFYPQDALDRNWPQRELEMAAADGRFEDEGWRLRKDGTPFWANVIITALRNVDGELIGFGKVSRDLTDRRNAEQRLRESEERLRLMIESTIDYAIFMIDPQGYVVSWNAGAERIKGYKADDIIGRHFSVFYPADAVTSGWPEHELREAARLGRLEDEGWRVRKDGTRFFANVVISALRGSDDVLLGYVKVTRDISERKAHERRIERLTRELEQRASELAKTNRELEQKNAENESFVYSVSHDLRSPLVNLQGFSQELMLSSDALLKIIERPGVPDEVRQEISTVLRGEFAESIGFIHNAVRHLGRIIDGLLRLSRVGRIIYDRDDVDVNAVVRDMLASLHTTIVASGARIEVDDLPTVKGDRNAIGQIFANILGNALKSFDASRPGRITISATRDSPPIFSIHDNGVGIPAEYRSKIFQVFQHVHRTSTPGEGMGLAIVRRIVERHGGRIWFTSSAGEGTTFFFTLSRDAEGASTDSGGTAAWVKD